MIHALRHHLRIYRIIVENAVSYEAQYRKDTIAKMVLNILWLGMLFVLIEIVFTHTASFAGWSKEAVYLLMLFWAIADEIDIAFFNQVSFIPDYITDGALDGLLIKPANTLFLATVNLRMKAIYRLVTELVVAGGVFFIFDIPVTVLGLFLGVILLVTGVIALYSLRLMLNTLAFWFYRISNINALFYMMQSLGQYPLDIYPKTARIVLLTAIPVGLVGFVPALAALGNAPARLIILAFGTSVALFILATCFWKFAIRRYTSASS